MPFIAVIYAPTEDAVQALMIREREASSKIVGLYEFPTKAEAECPGFRCPHHAGENAFGWGRHHTHGYIVHGACQRRRKGFRRRLKVSLLDLFGLNMLPREITPGVFQNPDGYDYPEAFPRLPSTG